ncbi:MAG TPA: DedA family protein [Blastocatellia bacterium]|nr:DedA family protein [Blastocatellia bacterium]
MDFLKTLIDFFLHLDQHLGELIRDYGLWTYFILFLIIFCETGLVVTPFLPGDSLLFAAGTFAARGDLSVWWLFILLTVAAIIGDTVNYWIGHYVGPKIFYKENVRFLNKKHLERTHAFYEKYGGKTIIIARFIPIIRTFAPFVAGIGSMTYWRFITYNVVGGVLWVGICVFAGFFFGNIEIVQRNFSLVVIAIIFISVLPVIIEFIRHRMGRAKAAAPESAPMPSDRAVD